MEVDKVGPRSLSNAQQQHRRDNLCFYYGVSKHLAASCSVKGSRISGYPWAACSPNDVKTSGTWSVRQIWEMRIQAVFCRISGLHHLSWWYFHGSTESGRNSRMATSHPGKRLQSFLGFANFYRWFINGFSKIVQPLVALTHKDRPFC